MPASGATGFRTTAGVAQLRRRLLSWYDHHRRSLPWRESRDPYRIWLSEVMLQQTRVAVVIERYGSFLETFPDIRALATAERADVLAAWSGLGYYRRARALHAAARAICRDHGAQVPGSAAALATLPGIGRYTAAAVASIAFGEQVAVLDGNVTRVLSRLLGKKGATSSFYWARAEELLAPDRPGDFNQAMMELGATVCLPKTPKCQACPLHACCATRGGGRRSVLRRRRRRRVHYRLARRGQRVFLVRRPPHASLMPDMWELPQLSPGAAPSHFTLRHSITVTDFRVEVSRGAKPGGWRGAWIDARDVPRLPLTGLARKILRHANVIQ